jgi:hypothetical protein
MKVFHCDHCDNLVFFENFRCVRCDHTLAYLLDLGVTGSLDQGEGEMWRSPLARANGKSYRLCQNYVQHNVCNWAIPSGDNNPYCLSCRLTRVIPDLSKPENKEAWFKLEVAKRRLIYSLLSLKLPVASKQEQPETGLAFELLADPAGTKAPRVLTGHDNGLITVNIGEADDAERERRRNQMHEPYRTLLGHFRHEIGHFYWDRLISNSPYLERFRALFGDDREDYAQALERHYKEGTPPDWQESFISAYASTHPWEDWAETWAHYLHMTDSLETAVYFGLSLKPKRAGEPALKPDSKLVAHKPSEFDAMIDSWHALTYLQNNLNRGMGLPDGYPFVISAPVIEKLRFVDEVVAANRRVEEANNGRQETCWRA